LINGKGHQTIDPHRPAVPFLSRPLAFEEGEDYTYWAADLTPGYFAVPDVERVHRHVVFLDKKYFIIYDDLALKDDAEPAHFSWLYHVYQETPVAIDSAQAAFSYRIGQVFADVQFANAPESIRIENREGRDGYMNPYTGEDDYPDDMERARSRDIFKSFLNKPLMANNLWVHTVEPARQFKFLSVLLARKGEDSPSPELRFEEEKKVLIILDDGSTRSVSFDARIEADVVIDVERVRRHAAESMPTID
jgi:hypothetical protein